MGISTSYSPMKISRTCTAGTEGVAGHHDTLECHPFSAWLQMLPHYRGPGGWLFQGRTRDMNPTLMLATSPATATRRGFMVATHVAVLARQDALLNPLLGRGPVDLWRHQPREDEGTHSAPPPPHQHQ